MKDGLLHEAPDGTIHFTNGPVTGAATGVVTHIGTRPADGPEAPPPEPPTSSRLSRWWFALRHPVEALRGALLRWLGVDLAGVGQQVRLVREDLLAASGMFTSVGARLDNEGRRGDRHHDLIRALEEEGASAAAERLDLAGGLDVQARTVADAERELAAHQTQLRATLLYVDMRTGTCDGVRRAVGLPASSPGCRLRPGLLTTPCGAADCPHGKLRASLGELRAVARGESG